MSRPRTAPSVRFWAKVQKTRGCWLWTGAYDKRPDKQPYGRFTLPDGPTEISAHRYAYVLTFGPIADDVIVLHTCDNPRCVRPSHLKLGTQQDNVDDMWRKGRARDRFGRLMPPSQRWNSRGV